MTRKTTRGDRNVHYRRLYRRTHTAQVFTSPGEEEAASKSTDRIPHSSVYAPLSDAPVDPIFGASSLPPEHPPQAQNTSVTTSRTSQVSLGPQQTPSDRERGGKISHQLDLGASDFQTGVPGKQIRVIPNSSSLPPRPVSSTALKSPPASTKVPRRPVSLRMTPPSKWQPQAMEATMNRLMSMLQQQQGARTVVPPSLPSQGNWNRASFPSATPLATPQSDVQRYEVSRPFV